MRSMKESPFPRGLFEKPWMKIKSFALTGPDTVISSLFAVINEDKLPSVTKLSIKYIEIYVGQPYTSNHWKTCPREIALPRIPDSKEGFIRSALRI